MSSDGLNTMSPPDDLLLIFEVQKHENLYNNQIPEHSDKNLTALTWMEIAKALNADVITCRTAWKRLRDSFVRARKASKSQKPKWKYYDNLMFLSRYIKHKPSLYPNSETSNNDEIDDVEEEDEESRSDDYSNVDDAVNVANPVTLTQVGLSATGAPTWTCSTIPYTTQDESDPLAKRPKLEIHEVDPSQSQAVLDALTQLVYNRTDSNIDSLDDFGKHVASTLRQLSRRTQSWAKHKISEILYEAEETEYQHLMNSVTAPLTTPTTPSPSESAEK